MISTGSMIQGFVKKHPQAGLAIGLVALSFGIFGLIFSILGVLDGASPIGGFIGTFLFLGVGASFLIESRAAKNRN